MRNLFSHWLLDGIMPLFLTMICAVYFYLCQYKLVKKSIYFITGILLIIISVVSPFQFLGGDHQMSAHMLSHVTLLLLAAPLLVLGIPENNHNKYLLALSSNLSKAPWLAWMAGVMIMWFWHMPNIFNRLFENADQSDLLGPQFLQRIQWISLVLAGILFSLPVIGPVSTRRMRPLHAVLYLSAACIFCSILGLLITFAPPGVYTTYNHPEYHNGFLNTVRNVDGNSMMIDQQFAGLVMWVPGCLIYLSASMCILFNWFKGRKHEESLITPNTLLS